MPKLGAGPGGGGGAPKLGADPGGGGGGGGAELGVGVEEYELEVGDDGGRAPPFNAAASVAAAEEKELALL